MQHVTRHDGFPSISLDAYGDLPRRMTWGRLHPSAIFEITLHHVLHVHQFSLAAVHDRQYAVLKRAMIDGIVWLFFCMQRGEMIKLSSGKFVFGNSAERRRA
ncbi:hypothetical protein ACFWP0_07245 [Achromobacter sp. NPDC058515]|uniref:hypothetical protein n=1 Tax=Achromobacter sp. NPDC058515 TaxID=3346533 RepID=UPI0036654C2B